jgi:menaquinone-dependent protoporphyrinogen oxidase
MKTSKILIIYSTTDGQTKLICEMLQRLIEQNAYQVTLISINDCDNIDLNVFDKIVLGASIRYGKHGPKVVDFINKNLEILDQKPNAFFSVNVVARKPEKNQPDTNPYLIKFLKKIPWKPKRLAVFAGKLDYPKCTFVDRQMIRFIMWMTKGPTHSDTVVEFTDWNQVEAFGKVICDM